jgi:hypothetical protein
MELAAIERACEIALVGNAPPMERAAAQTQAMQLGSNVENIPIIQAILDSSSNQYAIAVAGRSLMTLITDHWNNFSEKQRVDIRKRALPCDILRYLEIAEVRCRQLSVAIFGNQRPTPATICYQGGNSTAVPHHKVRVV